MTHEKTLLKELINIESISGNEIEIGNYIFDFLDKEGFNPEKKFVDKKRFNIVAKLGNPKIYLAAHMDTVMPYIKYSEDKTYIYGRGSCDTKASIATMITSAIEAKKQGVNNFGLIFTVGEETTLDGAKAIAKSKLKIPFVIVGEPTSLEIVNGHFGILIIDITAKGKAAHSSRPEKGINAIDKLISAISLIKAMPIYPDTLMSLVQINGGIADNIIPTEARAIFSFRISPNDTNNYFEKIKSITKSLVNVKAQEIRAIHCKVPGQLSFIKNIRTVKYLTELSFYKKGVVIGPGDIQYAHGLNEKISIAELSEAVKIYTKILENFDSK